MATPPTFLAPGQRYAEPGNTGTRPSGQVTILRVEEDADGLPLVVSRRANGEEFAVYAVQVEAAVVAGLLLPVAGAGRIGRC